MSVIKLQVGDVYENRGKGTIRRVITMITLDITGLPWYSENPRPVDEPVICYTNYRRKNKNEPKWSAVSTGKLYMRSFETWGRKIPARQEAIFPTINRESSDV